MKKITIKIALLFSVVCSAGLAHADHMLVNKYQLAKIFEKINQSWEVEYVKEIKHFNDIEVVEIEGVEGYSSGLTFTIRAQMFPDRVAETIEVFEQPAKVLFPDSPTKNPLIIAFQSITVNQQVQEKVLDSSEVKVQFDAMNGEKSAWVVYGQTVLDDTETIAVPEGNAITFKSVIDITKMDEGDAKDYFESYGALVSSLNAELQKMNNVHMSDWYEEETEQAEKRQNDLKKQTFSEITDKEVFMSLVGWQLNAENQAEEPASELGHWAYDDDEASDEYTVGIEVINYGKYYEMLYLVGYDEALDEDDDKLQALLNKLQASVGDETPRGAKSVNVRGTDYYGVAEVVVTYSLENSPKGKDIYKNAEGFAEFTAETYDKAQKIADNF